MAGVRTVSSSMPKYSLLIVIVQKMIFAEMSTKERTTQFLSVYAAALDLYRSLFVQTGPVGAQNWLQILQFLFWGAEKCSWQRRQSILQLSHKLSETSPIMALLRQTKCFA